MNLERIDFIKIGIVLSGFVTGNGFESSSLYVLTRSESLKLSSETILIQKSIISFVLFIVFYFGRDKYSILKISKEVSKDSGHQESFQRLHHLVLICYIIHMIWSI